MTFKIAATALALSATLLLSGCVSTKNNLDGFDATIVDPYVTLNQTTEADIRALLGTPTTAGTLKEDGSRVINFAVTTANTGAQFARNFGKHMLTLGFGSKKNEITQKNLSFKINADGIVTDYKKSGVAYLYMHRLTYWNECERALTDAEINSPVRYSDVEICQTYAADVAAKKGIKVEDVDIGEETDRCAISCQSIRALKHSFGELSAYEEFVDSLPTDGTKSDLLF